LNRKKDNALDESIEIKEEELAGRKSER